MKKVSEDAYKKGIVKQYIIPIRNILETRIGKGNAISNREIISQLSANGIICNDPAIVRQAISQIRVKKQINNLVAGGKGYYIENDPSKIHLYIKRLDDRIRAISRLRDSFYFQSKISSW